MDRKMREGIKHILEELYAIELLEYHDKNLLSGDNKSRSEWRQSRLRDGISILQLPNMPRELNNND